MPTPELSVIVASQGGADETARCLQSLLDQTDMSPEHLELVVSKAAPHAVLDALVNRFPTVKFVRAQGESVPLLHGAGIAASSGELVAVTEGHCTFPKEWAKAAIKAHRANSASAIGGAVELARKTDSFNTALFLCDYAQFVPPITAEETTDLPGNNVVFKRACLGDTDAFLSNGFWKTFFCKQLARDGHKLVSDGSLLVTYNRRLANDKIVARRYNHGRCFGAMRAQELDFLRRIVLAFGGPFLLPLLIYRLARRCFTREASRLLLMETAPYAVACLQLWALGEWVGSIFGAGSSCDRL